MAVTPEVFQKDIERFQNAYIIDFIDGDLEYGTVDETYRELVGRGQDDLTVRRACRAAVIGATENYGFFKKEVQGLITDD